MKRTRLVLAMAIAIIILFLPVLFSKHNSQKGNILEKKNDSKALLSKNDISMLDNSYSVLLKEESIDGSLIFTVIDSITDNVLFDFEHNPFNKNKPAYQAIGNDHYIFGNNIILAKDNKIIDLYKDYNILNYDYAVYDEHIAFICTDGIKSKSNNQISDAVACKVCIMDLANGYDIVDVDIFLLPYELSIEINVMLCFDMVGNLYYDYYDKTPSVKVFNNNKKSSLKFLNNAQNPIISPYDNYMVYLNISGSSKDERHNSILILYDLSNCKNTYTLFNNSSKLFWVKNKLIINNDHSQMFDVIALNNICKKVGKLDIPQTTIEIEPNEEGYDIKYISYNEDLSIKSKSVKSLK